MAAIDVIIGERGSDHIRLRVMSRTEQVARDYWDANWLATVVSVHVGGWKGTNDKAFFRTEELARFRAEVERLAAGKQVEAEFATMEPHLRFGMLAEAGNGPILISGTALDRLEAGNALTFKLTIPRTSLNALVARLKDVEKAFPTIGKE